MALNYKGQYIDPGNTLLDAFTKMDTLDCKLLLVMEGEKFIGLISVGDIQRAIIQKKPLDTKVANVLRKNIRVANPHDSFESVKQMMLEYRMELCPVVNDKNEITEIYFWEDIFQETRPHPASRFNLPIVVMAGGLGTRLRPLTNVLPKPLIPIGEKSIVEEIFSRFETYGCMRYFISVNYKAELIEYYLRNQNLPFELEFLNEEKPMGTAGSLSLLNGKIDQTFFVTNCDILIEQDYSEILDYHQSNKNEITIVSALKNMPIPYGTVDTGENGVLNKLVEKPDLTFQINSGMYILEPHLLKEIPSDKFFHITSLIELILERNGKVGVFPVSEGSWKDFGNWEEYLKVVRSNG